MNKTADTMPKFQTDYRFIRTVAEGKTQPCITFVDTRRGVVISFMCARKGGPVVPLRPGHFHRGAARPAPNLTFWLTIRGTTLLRRGLCWALGRQHGWTGILVAFPLLPAGLLKELLSQKLTFFLCGSLVLLRALAGTCDFDAGPRAPGVRPTVRSRGSCCATPLSRGSMICATPYIVDPLCVQKKMQRCRWLVRQISF